MSFFGLKPLKDKFMARFSKKETDRGQLPHPKGMGLLRAVERHSKI